MSDENKTPIDLLSQIQEIVENNRNNEWLRTTDLADYLNISTSQVHVLKNKGIFPHTKLAGTIYFKKADIDEALEANMVDIG